MNINFKLYCLVTICCSIFISELNAQSNPNFTSYKELEGVSISNIIADKNGQIWIASSNAGLMRYNGYDFKKFTHDLKDTNSIKTNFIYKLQEDIWNNIWISSVDRELIRYNPVTKAFKKYKYEHLVTRKKLEMAPPIYDFCTIGNKLLIAVSFDAPLEKSILTYDEEKDAISVFAPKSVHPDYSYVFFANHRSQSIIMGQDAQLYLLQFPDSIRKISAQDELQQLSNQSLFSDAAYDSKNKLWIVNKNAELIVFDDISKSPDYKYSFKNLLLQGIKGFVPTIIKFDHDQNIWIGSHQGLFFFNRKTEEFQKMAMPTDANGNPYKISTLCFDAFNNLWIGTQTGLLKYEAKPIFNSYSGKGIDSLHLIKGFIGSIIPSHIGNLNVISYDFLDGENKVVINDLNLKSNTFHRKILNDIIPKGANITGVGEVGNDTLRVGTDRGVFQVTNQGKQITKINLQGLPSVHPGVLQFFKDQNGNEWLGTLSYLYKKLKGHDSYTPIDLSKLPGGSDLSNQMIVEDGKKYGLWILSTNGLFLYDYAKDIVTRHGYAQDINKGNAFTAQNIMSTYTDDSLGIVWIGIRDGGLNKYELSSGKIKTYTTQDGLPDMSVNAILYDNKNDALWLGTGNGLSRYDIKTERFTNYSIADGINGKSFNTGFKTNDGQFLFGGETLIRFKPEDIKSSAHAPIVFIDDIKVSNHSISATLDSLTDHTTITLKHNQNNISIDYLGIHFTDSKENKCAYILENFDQEWIEVGSQHTAYYTNLPSGSYTFKVKAANSNGTWTETPAIIHIEILPPWWKTIWAYGAYFLALLGLASYLNNYFKQRVLKQERERNQQIELDHAKAIQKAYYDLEKSHESLKSTQSQLVQAEKMASLGELTAGIAHEIQNPLNFVNNFSDINIELIDEMREHLALDNKIMAMETADDIKANLEKITIHGRRADSIVKGMLQHSRKSTGQKEPTDINALADEYLRLAYHGLRAKEKNFNANFKTDLDPTIGEVNLIPQDIGRVFLNLITNAFHSVAQEEKKKLDLGLNEGYYPMVSVFTKKLTEQLIEIRIKDNGAGIPTHLIDKIFQPFFTTKPTGQGTGLGLSLAYDIVKMHGGTITVTSKEGVGAEFVIQLPI